MIRPTIRPRVGIARLRDIAALVALLLTSLVLPNAHAVTIDWVTVGDPGNAADTTTYGAVADAFQIMKFEFTNQQYADFLNSVDADGNNPNSVYNASMGSNARGGISFTSGAASGSKYAIRTNMGDKPVNFVSWFDAARVANWLQNGQGSGSTETGAYTLVGGQTSGTAPAANPGASYLLPTEDQWYKAAYYKGGGTNAGYWDYATQSDTAPTAVTAGSTGIGSAGIGSTANFANYDNGADWNSLNGNVTTVGTNGRPSDFGGFDLNGNVWEWNDGGGTAGNRVLRGGSFVSQAVLLKSTFRSADREPGDEDADIGFRLTAVPEPTTYAMALAGIACGGYSLFRRREQA
jgi:formylglycine-generating enzyme